MEYIRSKNGFYYNIKQRNKPDKERVKLYRY